MSNELFTSDATRVTRPATADHVIEAACVILSRRVRRGAALPNPRTARGFLKLRLAGHDHEIFAMGRRRTC